MAGVETPSRAEIRYATADDVSIAYHVLGHGPPDLVIGPGALSHLEVEWEYAGYRHFYERLAGFSRVIRERHGDKLAGIAVHIGARIVGAARPGEVLVSSTVRDLVAGSDLTFEDRGELELRGLPGRWQVHAVTG
jgi:hypothetical protein